jgi:MerR family transcriptional regulator, light-induced transcriptional regulator
VSHFSPKQAAQALGVSESSVKRWCDLGAVPVLRTAGGHRRIPRKSLEELLAQGGDLGNLLKSLPDTGAEASGGPDEVVPAKSEAVSLSETLEQYRDEFHDALRIGLESRCRQILHAVIESGLSRTAAADFLVTHAMHRFGHLWEHGELAIYQERRACGICLGLIHELRRSISIADGSPIAIGGAPRGDIYQLPSQLIELALCEAGWNATSLGCNLPIHSLVDAVSEYRPRLLWVSLSAVEAEESFVEQFNELAGALGPETALIIGGRAASDSLRPRLRYTAHCDNLTNLIELAAKLISR